MNNFELPAGMRRLDVQIHSTEDVANYLADAQALMVSAQIPEDEWKDLRLVLVQMLAARNTQLVQEQPQVSVPQMVPRMDIPRRR